MPVGVLQLRQPYQTSEVLRPLDLLNMFMQKKIADISKLPFMLSTLDHINSIRLARRLASYVE